MRPSSASVRAAVAQVLINRVSADDAPVLLRGQKRRLLALLAQVEVELPLLSDAFAGVCQGGPSLLKPPPLYHRPGPVTSICPWKQGVYTA